MTFYNPRTYRNKIADELEFVNMRFDGLVIPYL